MIVLADQDNNVWARGRRYVDEALRKRERWAEGLTLREEWLPDDTQFEGKGPFVLADDQPEGWNTRRQTESRVYNFMEASEELLRDATIPGTVDGSQSATYFKEIRKILLGHHMILKKLMQDVRNG